MLSATHAFHSCCHFEIKFFLVISFLLGVDVVSKLCMFNVFEQVAT